MQNVNLKIVLLSLLSMLGIGYLLIGDSAPIEKKQSATIVTYDKKEAIDVVKVENRNKIDKKNLKTKNHFIKKLSKKTKSNKLIYTKNNSNHYIQEKIDKQKQSNAIAKARYQREQYFKIQQKRAYQSRKNYQSMQQALRQRDPNKIKSNSNMMRSKQVRSYMAKNNYIKRQKQIQQGLKMQNKMRRARAKKVD